MDNKLHGSWKLVPLRLISKVEWGNTSITKKAYVEEGFPAFSAAGQDGQLSHYEWEGDAIILSAIGARCGKCFYARGKWTAIKNTIVIQPVTDVVNPKFLFYYLNDEKRWVISGSGQPFITMGTANETMIPLPPLPEQHRIVAKLDELMAKIDRSRARLERIPQILKRFRQSVLSAAVSGKLTEEWRERNKMVVNSVNKKKQSYEWRDFDFPSTWTWDYLGEISHHILGKMLDASKNKGEPTYYLRNISVRWFDFDLTNLALIRATQEDKQKFNIRNGDVLVCEGGEPGRAAVWEKGDNDLIFQKAIHRIRFDDSHNSKWLLYNLKNDAEDGSLERLFTGTGIKHLTLKSLSKYPLLIPPLAEQDEIVRVVVQLFDVAAKIESRCKKAKAQLDSLPQSLLAKSFRGELLPQDEKDEPATVLLERIVKERSDGNGSNKDHKLKGGKRGKKKLVVT